MPLEWLCLLSITVHFQVFLSIYISPFKRKRQPYFLDLIRLRLFVGSSLSSTFLLHLQTSPFCMTTKEMVGKYLIFLPSMD